MAAESSTAASSFNNVLNNLLGELGGGQEWKQEKRLSFSSISSVQTQPMQDSLVQDAVHGTVRIAQDSHGDSLAQIHLERDLLSPVKGKQRSIYDRVRQTSESHASEPSTKSALSNDAQDAKRIRLQDLFAPLSNQESVGRVVYPGGKRRQTRASTPDDDAVAQSYRNIVQDSEDNTQAFHSLLSRLDALETQFSPARPLATTPVARQQPAFQLSTTALKTAISTPAVDPSPARPFARDSSGLATTVNTPEDRVARKPVQETSHYSFDEQVPIYQVDTLSRPPLKSQSSSFTAQPSQFPKRLNELREEVRGDETPKAEDTPARSARVAVKTAESVNNLEYALDSLAHLKEALETQVDNMANVLNPPQSHEPRDAVKETAALDEPVKSLSKRLLEDALGRVLVPLHRLDKLSLAKLGLETLIGLDEYCPNLTSLDLSRNKLEFLYGLPTRCLLHLDLRRNFVSTLTSFSGLDMLSTLDLSHNLDLSELSALSRLPRLQTLDLSGCDSVRDLTPLLHLPSLTRLKVVSKNARIKHVVVSSRWEWVTIVGCHVQRVAWEPADRFALIGLTLDDNSLESFALAPSCMFHGLRTLSLAKNRLTRAPDCDRMPQLRHLDLGSNAVSDVTGLRVSSRDIINEVDREPAGMRGPMLLQRLILSGNKLQDLRSVMKVFKRLLRLECVDLRNNPLTERFYPASGRDSATEWIELDDAFRQAMTDGEYARRALYRAVLIRALKPDLVCSLQGLQLLDGVPVTRRERQKSDRVLARLRGK